MALAVCAGAWLAWHTSHDGGGQPEGSAPPAAGWVRIHVHDAPGLCVGEGHERGGAYEPVIAAQQPCGGLRVQRTHLGAAGDGYLRIEWHHPSEGISCLTVLGSEAGPAEGMLAPRGRCEADNDRQRFRFEAAGPRGSHQYRIRPAHGGGCLGIAGGGNATGYAGYEIVREDCTSETAGQTFVIEPLPTGGSSA